MTVERILANIPKNMRIVNALGQPTIEFQVWLQKRMRELDKARSYMSDLFPLTIFADHTGTPTGSQLPMEILCRRYLHDEDVTNTSDWSVTVDEGTIDATIGANDGALTLDAPLSVDSVVTVTSVRNGLSLSRSFAIHRQDAAAPPSGGGGGGAGGTTATDSAPSGINSASYAQITTDLYVTVGSAGEVDLTAPLTVRTANDTLGTYEVKGIWRRYSAGSYSVDIDAEVASDPDCEVVLVEHPAGDRNRTLSGTLNVNPPTVTGLTPAAVERFALFAKNTSGTKAMTFTGTASAVGS